MRPSDLTEPREAPAARGRLLTADDLADRWSVSRDKVYAMARDGHLNSVRVGRYVRFRTEAVEAFELEGGRDAG